MKEKKLTKTLIILAILIILTVAGKIYLFQKYETKNFLHGDMSLNELNRGESISSYYLNQDNKIIFRFNLIVEAGNMKVSFYKVPEEHPISRARKMDSNELGEAYQDEGFRKALSSTEGLEMVYSVVIDETGVTEIDTSDFEDGVYAVSTIGSDDSVITGGLYLDYVVYKWMMIAEKFTDYEYGPFE